MKKAKAFAVIATMCAILLLGVVSNGGGKIHDAGSAEHGMTPVFDGVAQIAEHGMTPVFDGVAQIAGHGEIPVFGGATA